MSSSSQVPHGTVKEFRKSKHLTQRQLAEKSHVGLSTIIRLEAGSSVTPATLKAVARALGVGTHQLEKVNVLSRVKGTKQ